MKNFTYKRTETQNMKIVGVFDKETMTVDVDGDEKSLSTLLSPFEGTCVEIKVVTKNEQELDEPTSEFDPDADSYDV